MKIALIAIIFLIVGANIGYLLGAAVTVKMLAEHVEEGDVEDVKRN